jgi:hypothetical protein
MNDEDRQQVVNDAIAARWAKHFASHDLNLADPIGLPPCTEVRVASHNGSCVEFVIVDGTTGAVRLTNSEYNVPVEGRVIGSLAKSGPIPSQIDDQRVLHGDRLDEAFAVPADDVMPLRVMNWHAFIYEVDGKTFVVNGAAGIDLTLPSGTKYAPWHD